MRLPHLTSSCHCEKRSDAAVSSNSTHSIFYVNIMEKMWAIEYVIATTCFQHVSQWQERDTKDGSRGAIGKNLEVSNKNTEAAMQWQEKMRAIVYVIATTCFQQVSQWREKKNVSQWQKRKHCTINTVYKSYGYTLFKILIEYTYLLSYSI